MRALLAPVFACVVFCSCFALAQTATASGAPVVSSDYSKEAYVVERYDMRVSMESDGSGTRELTARVKVLAEAGVKAFAVLSFTYTSANEAVDVDYVRVLKPDGSVVKTPEYNVQDMPSEVTRSAPMYSDIHEKHVAVKGLGAGDTLEYLVRFRIVKPQVPGEFWFEHSFLKDAIVQNETLEISVPVDKYVKVVSPEFKPEIKDDAGRRLYHWTHANLEVKENDPNELSQRIPPSPSVQMTTFASWEDVGRWYGGLQKEPLVVTPAIQEKAAQLTKGLGTDDEKIRAIYNFVALRFHYIGLDFGIGRYQPHAADDVLGNGYGDCKDKHTLLASLLKTAGYEAWPALIHAQRKLDPDVPSPAQFNHVITVVVRGDKLIWLDTTPEVAPYGLLMIMLRDKDALVIPSNKAPVLMKTPAEAAVPQQQAFTVEGALAPDGTFTGHIEQSYRGDAEILMRLLFRQVSQSHWKEAAQGFSSRLGFGGDVSNVQVSSPEETEKPFRLSYDYVRKNYSDWDHKQFAPPLPPMGLELAQDKKKPLEPLLLGAPGEIVYRSKFVLPAGYNVEAPNSLNLVEPYAEYHSLAGLQDGALATSRRLVIKKSEVALDQWESFRKFAKAMSDDEWNFISLMRLDGAPANQSEADQKFQQAVTAAAWGDLTKAKDLYKQVIASDAKYRGAHLNLGSILAKENKIEEARSEWNKEQEVNPADMRSYQVPASYWIYAGRKDDAIEEWRKFMKANPQHHEGAMHLSQLLSQSGKYSEAEEVLQSAIAKPPENVKLHYALGSVYLKAGQGEKAIAEMRAAAEGTSSDPMTLNDVSYTLAENHTGLDLATKYAQEALRQLDERSLTEAINSKSALETTYEISLLWDTLGWIYFANGDTSRALSLVHAAWVTGQAGEVGSHLGEIYEKEGKKNEAAHAYQLALATFPPAFKPSFTAASTHPASSDKNKKDVPPTLREKILGRYVKLTGKPPSEEVRRLADGEWTKTPSQELSEMRATKFGKLPGLSGSAEFLIAFVPGKIESVQFVSGEKNLDSLSEKLRAAKFMVEFPESSRAKIVRRAEVSCTPTVGCMAVLLLPDKAVASN